MSKKSAGFGGVALTSLLVADMELELKPTVTQARVIDIIKDDMIAKENKTAAVKFIQVPTFYSVPICASNSSYLPGTQRRSGDFVSRAKSQGNRYRVQAVRKCEAD